MGFQHTARVAVVVSSVSVLLFLPAAAWAQGGGTGAIAGVARDSSGAVLPGVAVEAASPALIEKVRTAVTDGQGVYRIVDLRPGTYTVTFTLPGFSTVRREGLELTTGFTATVNAELTVGALEETVTVSGAAPVVDTQNVLQQRTLARETLDALPTTLRMGSYATLVPGAVAAQDVGGLNGERGNTFAVHGQRPDDMEVGRDGMDLRLLAGSQNSWNPHDIEEVVLETSGISAEAESGGTRVSLVPKDGGNTFSGSFRGLYSSPDLQSDNLTGELRDRGLFATPSLKQLYDAGGSLGGPLRRDRLWFFTTHRRWGASRFIPGLFFNGRQGTLFYEPDTSRPAFTNDFSQDHTVRLTWQASTKDKVSFSYTNQVVCQCPIDNLAAGTIAPEAGGNHYYQPNWIGTVTWRRPTTNRILLEAGVSGNIMALNAKRHADVRPTDIPVLELSTNLRYGARGFNNVGNACCYSTNAISHLFNQRFAVSYVTGSHNVKVGVNLMQSTLGHKNHTNIDAIPGARFYTFRNQVPVSVTLWATPFGIVSETLDVGVYAQDQWTMGRLTLNLGLRYDSFNASVPAQHLDAGYFVPARDFTEVKDSPDWRNLGPRLGAAYDLFGTGRTAVKVAVGRYAIGTSANQRRAINNPMESQATSATRTWNDANGNFVPDCVLGPTVPGANGECGALSDRTFGLVREGSTRFAADALSGFNSSQPYNWQGSIAVQHELRSGMAINVGYFRTWYGNFVATDNLALTPADFGEFCITAPVDSRLPGGGGQQMCGLYDIAPGRFGQVDNLVTLASHYGKQREVYDGVDVVLNTRFGQGGQLSGGLSVGRTVTDNCFVVDSPQQARPGFCEVTPPWSAGTQLKFLVVYPLPWDFQASAVYQNIPGIPITASYVATNAAVAPSLGRNLGACRGAATCNATATIELIPPNTLYEDRFQRVDFRIARIFRVRDVRLEGIVNLYNMFNVSPVQTTNTRFGPQWLTARSILPGRVVQLGAQLAF